MISTERTHFFRGGQFPCNRLILAWKIRTIPQRKQEDLSIALDSSAIDRLVWSVLKFTPFEPNYKEKEVHWPTGWTNSEPRSAFFVLSHWDVSVKNSQENSSNKNKPKKELSNLIEAEITGHLRRWEGGTVRYTFFVLCICQYWIESFIRVTNVIKHIRY